MNLIINVFSDVSRGKTNQNKPVSGQDGDNSVATGYAHLAMVAAASYLQRGKKTHERLIMCPNCGTVKPSLEPCNVCNDPVF